mmetsp:Transcript_39211/g.82003  ORF Transcript_39211/g.82003 Transcript_39211/m.82003 type:complete len:121 (-) Transcript_39211:317-679(-)
MVLTKAKVFVSILAACSSALPAHAFIPASTPAPSRSQLNNDAGGGIEEIEFRIYPDGRITEVVRGVKGKNCQDVTAAINKQLGNVVDVQPTEEMFEEEVLVEQTLEQTDGTGGWDGASSW